MKIAVLALPILLLAACDVPSSGSGALSDGTPVIGNRVARGTTAKEQISFVTVDGLDCSGEMDRAVVFKGNRTSGSFPVRCTDGSTGTVIAALPHGQLDRLKTGDFQFAFSLTNGKKGSFRI